MLTLVVHELQPMVSHAGAFVDKRVHQDGLVHISQLADLFVKNPVEVMKSVSR